MLINKISDYSNEDKVTTSINDAELDIPYLDDFNPDAFASMIILPRSTNGGFQLRPGLFEFNAQSYCLHAGKYGPTKGEGYLSAPLNGSRADIIRNILRNSTQYADIPQNEIQLLLWGILANTKISDMSKEVQLAASRLLTPLELISINGGVIGLIPDKLLEKTISSLPLQIQSTLKLESQIRQLLTKANVSYKEIENIAVKLGAAPIGEGSRTIPSGRWGL